LAGALVREKLGLKAAANRMLFGWFFRIKKDGAELPPCWINGRLKVNEPFQIRDTGRYPVSLTLFPCVPTIRIYEKIV
jgi:hypothetical protein